jgi:F0F1-type ATP synthase membrane subunit c/vacuolar-type H+-ATPase subunit K
VEGDGGRALATARLIAVVSYAVAVLAYPVVGVALKVKVGLSPQALAVVGPAVLAAGVVDYVISLAVERALLEAAQRAPSTQRPMRVTTAAVTTAALGESLALLGLVVSLLGARGWGGLLYLMCLQHGLHLGMRWPSYESAAAGQ